LPKVIFRAGNKASRKKGHRPEGSGLQEGKEEVLRVGKGKGLRSNAKGLNLNNVY